MAKYLVQKCAEFDKQSSAFKKEHTLRELERTHIAQAKYDGCHLVVRVAGDGVADCFSRTGEDNLACQHIADAVKRIYGVGWVVFGEVWMENTPFPEISGAFRRHSPQPQLKFVPFDIVPSGSYAIGMHDVPYHLRMKHLYQALRHGRYEGDPFVECRYYPPGTYGDPQAIANQLVASGGYDGLILRDLKADWVQGEVKNGEIIKVKPVMSLDLKVVGGKGEQRATKLGGYLTVIYNGIESDVGSGLTQVMCQALLTDSDTYTGMTAEVECLGITEDGKLREPRFKGFRYDKLKPD